MLRTGARALILLAGSVVRLEAAPAPTGLVVLVSGPPAAYREAQDGVVSTLEASHAGPFRTITLDDPANLEEARRTLAAGPSLVVAIGTRAAKLAMLEAPSSPLVYAMVLDPASIGLPAPGSASAGQITGVAMDVTPDKQYGLMRSMVPGLRRIGVIYDPSVSGEAVRRASAAAKLAGLTLVAQAVRSDAEVMGAAELIMPGVDLLWAIADPTVLTEANARALILACLRARKPLFAISEGYVRNGALAALSAHPLEVGRRAGEMTSAILLGAPVRSYKPELPPRVSLFLNQATARRLGLDLPQDILSRASVVYPRQ